MKIHEYQARSLFRDYGIACPADALADSPEAARQAADQFDFPVVVKAQVLSGGRGKAGGVKLAKTLDEVEQAADKILDLTIQSYPVENILLAHAVEIDREFYVGLTIDRSSKAITLMISGSGGVEIETLAVENPDAIHKIPIYPATGLEQKVLRPVLDSVFENESLVEQATTIIDSLYRLFTEKDCSLVEINPLALTPAKELLALDAKVNFDDNGLMKHDDIEALRNDEESSKDELKAREVGLSFVSMDGDIGCIVNGAGLAMATMDLIKHFGGTSANFLDVGGSSNPEKVLNALKIILGNSKVHAILVNIFGGITRCDDIAKGILMATEQIDIPVPMVIRLIGTNDETGRKLLSDAGFTTLDNLTEAVKKVVKTGQIENRQGKRHSTDRPR